MEMHFNSITGSLKRKKALVSQFHIFVCDALKPNRENKKNSIEIHERREMENLLP